MVPRINGVFPALTTPFEKGELLISEFESNIKKYNNFDFGGYLVLGSTGESVLMNEKEKLRAIECVRKNAADGKIIIAGTGLQSAKATIDLSNSAAEAGAEYALVVTPFYYKGQMTADSLELYYKEVADKVNIPVLIYNVPKFTGVNIPSTAVKELSRHGNIAGIKESSGDISFLGQIIRDCPSDFSILQGGGSVIFSSFILGASGAILALSNMAPAETVEIEKLVREAKTDRAKEIQLRLIEVNQKIVGAFGVPGIKYSLDILGYFGGDPRPPLRPVAREAKEIIERLLSEAGLK